MPNSPYTVAALPCKVQQVVSFDKISVLDFIGAKDDGSGGDNWSCKTCKGPVKSSPSTNQRQAFLQAGCPSGRPTNSVWALKGEISHSTDLLTRSSHEGLPTLYLTTKALFTSVDCGFGPMGLATSPLHFLSPPVFSLIIYPCVHVCVCIVPWSVLSAVHCEHDVTALRGGQFGQFHGRVQSAGARLRAGSVDVDLFARRLLLSTRIAARYDCSHEPRYLLTLSVSPF